MNTKRRTITLDTYSGQQIIQNAPENVSEGTSSNFDPQTYEVDALSETELNRKIQEGMEKYLSSMMNPIHSQYPQSQSSFMASQQTYDFRAGGGPSFRQSPIQQQDPQLILEQNKMVYSSIIDSFTAKIEDLQNVINQQKSSLDQKDKEIRKLKQTKLVVDDQSSSPPLLQQNIKNHIIAHDISMFSSEQDQTSFEINLQKNERERLRKFIKPENTERIAEYEELIKTLKQQNNEKDQEIQNLFTENNELQDTIQELQEQINQASSKPSTSNAFTSCKIISEKQIDELKAQIASLENELFSEKQNSALLRQQLIKADQDQSFSKEKKNSELFQAIQSLKGELEIEKRVIEVESLKSLLSKTSSQNEQLLQDYENLQLTSQQQQDLLQQQISSLQKQLSHYTNVTQVDFSANCLLLSPDESDELRESLQCLTNAWAQDRVRMEEYQLTIKSKDNELQQERQNVLNKNKEIEEHKMINEKWNNEYKELKSKYQELKESIETKDNFLKTVREEFNAKESLHQVRLETEKAQAKLLIEQEKQKLLAQFEEERNQISVQISKPKYFTSDASLSCEILTLRETQTLRSRLETLSKDLEDYQSQIETMEDQLNEKDIQLRKLRSQLKEFESGIAQRALLQREHDYLRRQVTELQNLTQSQSQQLIRLKSAADARDYVQEMMKRQKQRATEDNIRAHYDKERTSFVQSFNEEKSLLQQTLQEALNRAYVKPLQQDFDNQCEIIETKEYIELSVKNDELERELELAFQTIKEMEEQPNRPPEIEKLEDLVNNQDSIVLRINVQSVSDQYQANQWIQSLIHKIKEYPSLLEKIEEQKLQYEICQNQLSSYQSEINRVKESIGKESDDINQKNQTIQIKLEKKKTKVQSMKLQHSQLSQTTSTLQAQIDQLQEANHQLDSQVEFLQAQLSSAQQEKYVPQSMCSEIQCDILNESHLMQLSSDLSHALSLVETQSENLKTSENLLLHYKEQQQHHDSEKTSLLAQVSHLQQSQQNLMSEVQLIKSEKESFESMVKEKESAIAESKHQLQILRDQIENDQAIKDSQQQELESLKASGQKAQNKYQKLKQQRLNVDTKELQCDIIDARDVSEQQQINQVLRQQKDEQEAHIALLQEQIENAQNDKLQDQALIANKNQDISELEGQIGQYQAQIEEIIENHKNQAKMSGDQLNNRIADLESQLVCQQEKFNRELKEAQDENQILSLQLQPKPSASLSQECLLWTQATIDEPLQLLHSQHSATVQELTENFTLEKSKIQSQLAQVQSDLSNATLELSQIHSIRNNMRDQTVDCLTLTQEDFNGLRGKLENKKEKLRQIGLALEEQKGQLEKSQSEEDSLRQQLRIKEQFIEELHGQLNQNNDQRNKELTEKEFAYQRQIQELNQQLSHVNIEYHKAQEMLHQIEIRKDTAQNQEVSCDIITEKQIESSQSRIQKLESSNEELNEQISSFKVQLYTVHQQNHEKDQEITQLKQGLLSLEEKIRDHIHRENEQVKSIEQLESQIEALKVKAKTQEAETECQILDQQIIDDLQDKIQQQLSEFVKQNQLLQNQSLDIQGQSEQQIQQIQQLEQNKKELSQQITTLKEQMLSLQQEISGKDSQIKSQEDIIAQQNKQIQEQIAVNTQQLKNHEQLEQQLHLVQQRPQTSSSSTDCDIITPAHLSDLQSQLTSLQQSHDQQLSSLAQQHQLALQSLSSENNNQMQNATQAHSQKQQQLTHEIDELKAQLNMPCEKCSEKDKILGEVQDEVEKLKREGQQNIRDYEQEKSKIMEISEGIKKERDQLKSKLENETMKRQQSAEAINQQIPSKQEEEVKVEKQEEIKVPEHQHVIPQSVPQTSSTTNLVEPSKEINNTQSSIVGTYIFCYGSNHPVAMAKIFNMSTDDFLMRCISAGLPGYGRVFVGQLPNWGNASIANIIQHAKSEVEGYAVKLKPDELSLLDQKIGYPKVYNRVKVQIKKLPFTDGDTLHEAEVYIIIDKSLLGKYKRPNNEYLDATTKTLSASLYLRNGPYEDNKHEIKLKVFKQTDISLDLMHETFASMKYLGVSK